MELVFAFIGGMVLATLVAYFVLHNIKTTAAATQERLLNEQQLRADLETKAATAKIQAELDTYKQHIAEEKAERLQRETEAKEEREKQEKKQLELLSAQFESASERLLKQRAEELGKVNTENVGKLLNPLQQEMENVRKLMGETRSANEKSTASLEGALKAMIQQTNQISQDANSLADALKNRGKVHGDWGEQVLEDILSGSGLREGIEYNCQQSFKGEHGNELRPDVVINCADGKRIIIDSKVSLTAYADALGAATAEERDEAVRKNCESVKKHVKELADKQYPKYVEGAMNYVLMFVPNEGAYVMAMNYDCGLAQNAFRQGVVIVNPTNLMLTLHLVLQTWQQTRQEDNCKKILDAANGMYDKIIGLVDTCHRLGSQLDTANKTYATAMNQLSEGAGNVLRRVEGLKELGITSTKRVKKATTSENLSLNTDSEQICDI